MLLADALRAQRIALPDNKHELFVVRHNSSFPDGTRYSLGVYPRGDGTPVVYGANELCAFAAQCVIYAMFDRFKNKIGSETTA